LDPITPIDLSTLPAAATAALDEIAAPTGPGFLRILETTGAADAASGWEAAHVGALRDGALRSFLPLYLKDHSAGEFFFDWSWAQAIENASYPWYPKAIAAIPFTPLRGRRLLTVSDDASEARALRDAALAAVTARGLPQLQVLFVDEAELPLWTEVGALHRTQVRYVWRDRGFGAFDGYLAALRSRRRKSIRNERKQVERLGLDYIWMDGDEPVQSEWARIYACYARTYAVRGQLPYLSPATLRAMGAALREAMPILTVRHEQQIIGVGLFLRAGDTLYGRHWGALEDLPGLHFEACYYRGIERCLAQGIATFDPGVQGEHKLLRGFLPELSHAAYWFRDAGWRDAFTEVLDEERRQVARHFELAAEHDPFVRTRGPD